MRGGKPKGLVKCVWSPEFTYAIGLLAADGSLSSNGRHIDFTSKDKCQVENFSIALGIKGIKIGEKFSGRVGDGTVYYRLQFGDVLFYRFLQKIGFSSAKSTTLGAIEIPDEYFFDFLRGVFDGDGCIYSYWDKRWKSSFMFYVSFISAAPDFLIWIRANLNKYLKIHGHVDTRKPDGKRKQYQQLKYAKKESLLILKQMYKNPKIAVLLPRKYLKAKEILAIVGEQI
ncbi:hypothetical protein COB55_05520 [Candidatus Wolfebacteria bacterium]|nr:MAG: hypothetical protein COB55_05520 [Candidatus Wolfebacteria bacterium]